ncbi:DNA-binding response regulator (plasmid) [Leptolinea sp. HRD-7]|jgi:DNA-binding NarL/FixJ family response regulator|nr:DNA-binding response regulator [Leptolinea sp. HRD-7]
MKSTSEQPVKIRVLLADDQRLMRDGLRTLLELEDDLEVVGEAENGRAALELAASLRPDVVLMDVRMPVMDGVEATRQLAASLPECRVIILTTFDDESIIFEGLRAGALGYLLKDVSGEELASAIREVNRGGALIQPSVARKVLAEFSRLPAAPSSAQILPGDGLSERETEILKLVARGLSNKEIALRLSLTEGTVKNYVSAILQKLGVQDRTQAALKARGMGI